MPHLLRLVRSRPQGLADTAPKGERGKAQGGKYWKYGGDFGDSPTDYDFCLNGINFPDQTPKPAMYECKYLFAPVSIKTIHPQSAQFIIENKYNFTNLDVLSLHYTLIKNGTQVLVNSLDMPDIAPGESTTITLKDVASALSLCTNGEEFVLRTDFVYKEAQPFAKANDVCLSTTLTLYKAVGLQNFMRTEESKLTAKEAKEFAKSFTPTLFRAMLENEGIKKQLDQLNSEQMPWCFFNKPTKEWLNTGINAPLITKTENSAESSVKWNISSPESAISKVKFATCTASYSIANAPNGKDAVKLDVIFNLTPEVSEYPRVGLTTDISADFTDVKWYGNGPYECYCDRKASSLRELHSMKIADLEVPYIVPQENGSRCNTLYLELCAANGKAIHIQSITPFSFNISKYTTEDLFKCHHTSELIDLTQTDKPHWVLHIDAAHRGVGTGACGPDTLEEYRIRSGTYKLSLLIW